MAKLQKGAIPWSEKVTGNPDALTQQTDYHRALVAGSAGAMPSETYQYDIVYETFRKDTEFWKNWNVVDCARNSTDESISQENASIRVVMDLPSSQKLYPTAYTPGFPTVPCTGDFSQMKARLPQPVAGLPPGYSVALDVHILEDARVMLKHQKAFRDGCIDPTYEWLAVIVDKADGTNELSSSVQGQQLAIPAPRAKVRSRPEAALRPEIGSPAVAELVEVHGQMRDGYSEALKPFSDMYGERRVVTKHVSTGKSVVHAESTLVSAFGNDRGLPTRDSGTWASAKGKSDAEVRRDQALGNRLDRDLNALLDRRDPPPAD